MNEEENKKSKRETLIQYLKTSTPKQLLTDLAGGVEPSMLDIRLVEELSSKFQLKPEVINVLIQYTLLKNDMKLTKQYAMHLANHWTKINIETAEQAMDQAMFDHKQNFNQESGQSELTKVNQTRLIAIEEAVRNPDMTDEELGKFVRNMFTM